MTCEQPTSEATPASLFCGDGLRLPDPCENDRARAEEVRGDTINHPAHYTFSAVECIDAIESATAHLNGVDSYLTGQVLKYMWRWSKKNGREDLAKARWYLNRLITLKDREVRP